VPFSKKIVPQTVTLASIAILFGLFSAFHEIKLTEIELRYIFIHSLSKKAKIIQKKIKSAIQAPKK